MVLPGDVAPFFQVASSVNPKFVFDTVAGRYIVLSFFGSSRIPSSAQFLAEMARHADRFDVVNTIFFGVTNDPDDAERLKPEDNGRIYFYDFDLAVSRAYGVVANATPDGAATPLSRAVSRQTFVLDQGLRVIGVLYMQDDDIPRQVAAIFSLLDSMPKLNTSGIAPPVLIVPYVFELALCQRLISYYQGKGGEDSGFMRDVDGKTVGVYDYSHKRRMDCEITDEELIGATQDRIKRRVAPAIRHAYQFNVSRIERHIVACYDAAQGAHFRAHRDNTTLGTAHRRFAVTINLNSPDYEGGEIWFPEFARTLYKAPSGAAIVFSCSLLHEVPPVTRGKRYAFLPFLYDDAAAAIRDRNRQHLDNLSDTVGGRLANVCQSEPAPKANPAALPVIDGNAGCGNPDGCGTCLTAAAYPLNGTPEPKTGETEPIVKGTFCG